MRKPIEKIKITPEMKQTHSELKAFLKRNPEIESKELRPIGFSVNIGTIPKSKSAEFLEIVYKHRKDER